jgi:ABC-type multidrug transport system fused ATPase/permease subunit
MWKSIATIILGSVLVVVIVTFLAFDTLNPKELIGFFILSFSSLLQEKRTELIFTFASNLLGTFVGAGLAFFFALHLFKIQSNSEAKKKRIDTTFDLLQEFSTHEMAEARSQADKIFTAHKTATSIEDFYRNLTEDEKRFIRQVLFFFRRLQLSIEYNRVEASPVLKLFGGEFIWLYYVWFESLIVPAVSWDTSHQMRKLQKWMEKQSKRGKRSKRDYEHWKSEAYESRNKRLSAQTTTPQTSSQQTINP